MFHLHTNKWVQVNIYIAVSIIFASQQNANYVRITTMLDLATADIKKYSKNQHFEATFVAIFTWSNLLPERYYNPDRDNVRILFLYTIFNL